LKVVLDANVIISAFASRGLCVEIFRICLTKHEIILSEHLLEEIKKGFIRKLKVPATLAHQRIDSIKSDVRVEMPAEVPAHSCRDPKDLHVLGLALASKAQYIVSGDEDLWSLKKFKGTLILQPRGFWEILKEKERPRK